MWARKDVNHAIADLKTLLEHQLPDGRIPEETNWLADRQGFFAKLGIRFQWSHVAYNDITQMPVLPYRFSISPFSFSEVSLRAIFEQSNDVELLKEIVPKLVK